MNKFKSPDANSCFTDLVESGIPQDLSYNLISLLDDLQFSAWEMWITKHNFALLKVTEEQISEFRSLVPAGLSQKGYYSKEVKDVLVSIYKKIKRKEDSSRTPFEKHLFNSISKELICYRGEHAQFLNDCHER